MTATTEFYILTQGEYSDYKIVALLKGPSGYCMDVLKAEYKTTKDFKARKEAAEKADKWFNEDEGLLVWLTTKMGFTEIEYE